MSEKRRDSKNRILRTGESQEADGRYKFRYVDANGKRKSGDLKISGSIRRPKKCFIFYKVFITEALSRVEALFREEAYPPVP